MKLSNISKNLVLVVSVSSLLTACCTPSANGISSVMGWNQGPAVQAYQNSIWGGMSRDFKLNHYAYRKEVQKHIHELQANKADFYHSLQKSAPYIRYIYEQTQQKNMPAELALLPLVESEFNPYAKSHVGASGLWQLMPGTASGLGVKSASAYDGRRDVYASTKAALAYLSYLNNFFKNDWILAIAAYNCGPGGIQKAAGQKSHWYKQATFWDLNKLPKETKAYIPKLLALAAVVQDPARYGMQLPTLNNAPQLAAVKTSAKVDLKKVATSTGVGVETMRTLNPGYRNMSTTTGAPNTLLVPADKVEGVKAALVHSGKTAVVVSVPKTIPNKPVEPKMIVHYAVATQSPTLTPKPPAPPKPPSAPIQPPKIETFNPSANINFVNVLI